LPAKPKVKVLVVAVIRRFEVDIEVCCVGTHPICDSVSHRGLNVMKLARNK